MVMWRDIILYMILILIVASILIYVLFQIKGIPLSTGMMV